jgi:hypothetical protein
VRVLDLLSPFEREEDGDTALLQERSALPGVASPAQSDLEPEFVGEADPTLDVSDARCLANDPSFLAERRRNRFRRSRCG